MWWRFTEPLPGNEGIPYYSLREGSLCKTLMCALVWQEAAWDPTAVWPWEPWFMETAQAYHKGIIPHSSTDTDPLLSRSCSKKRWAVSCENVPKGLCRCHTKRRIGLPANPSLGMTGAREFVHCILHRFYFVKSVSYQKKDWHDLTVSSTGHICNEGIFVRPIETKYVQLHMSYTCLAKFVHCR